LATTTEDKPMKRDDTTHVYISPKSPPYVREVLTEALTQAGAHITEVPAAYMDELLMDSLSNKESVEQPSTDESLREIIPLHKHPTLKLAHELIGDLVPHLESMCSSAFIAGGCPRDLYTGLVCKDIDIFTSAINDQNIIGLTIIATQFAQKHNLNIAISEKYDFIGGGILTIKIADCIDLCLTKEAWRTPHELISLFDMVASQAWLQRVEDGFSLHYTELFRVLDSKKVLGYYPHLQGSDNDHVQRIAKKYPDYLLLALDVPSKPEPTQGNQEFFDDIPF
jgi:hypothetical protein